MILIKNDKLEVDTPSTIKLDGVYSAIICNVDGSIIDKEFSCTLYIPEVYGRLNILGFNTYPKTIIPYKQDNDDEGHVPQVGEVVKVSFDDGEPNSCRFLYAVPMLENSNALLLNQGYIQNGNLPSDLIIDTDDPNLIEKVSAWLKDAYKITIGKDEPEESDFSWGLLCSFSPVSDKIGKGNIGSIQSFFIKPLTMLLPIYSSYVGEVVPIFYEVAGYALYELMIKLFNDEGSIFYSKDVQSYIMESLAKAKDDAVYYGYALSKLGDDIETNIKFFLLSICAILNDDVVNRFFPAESDSNEILKEIEYELIGTDLYAPFVWIWSLDFGGEQFFKNVFSRFLFKYCKEDYEYKWKQTCVAWMSGINAIVNKKDDNKSIDNVRKAVCLCLTICPWLSYTSFMNSSTDTNIISDGKIPSYINPSENMIQLYYPNSEDFIEAVANIQNAIKSLDVNDIINTFESEAKKIFGEAGWEHDIPIESNVWPSRWGEEGMAAKFKTLRSIMNV